jgi:hypothetical protein
MNVTKIAKLCVIALGSSFLCIACAAETQDEPTSESTDQDLSAAMTSCHTDADCVAVDVGGCCPNGTKVAVNSSHEHAYESSHACKHPGQQVCPLYLINDTRVAECGTNNKCQMVAIDKIKCGGFVMHPHTCPSGYDCDHTGKNPDVPGSCVESKPKDCRDTGCKSGSHCSPCWGKFACIPKGAVC